jgi:uncharacterized spore protein YtfJ
MDESEPAGMGDTDMAVGVLGMVREAVSAGRVFAEPVERDGTTVIGVARVQGGGGGEQLANGATAGGLGLIAGPVGAYVIRDGRVWWIPAVDVNRLILAVVVIVLVIQVRKARRRRASSERQRSSTSV